MRSVWKRKKVNVHARKRIKMRKERVEGWQQGIGVVEVLFSLVLPSGEIKSPWEGSRSGSLVDITGSVGRA